MIRGPTPSQQDSEARRGRLGDRADALAELAGHWEAEDRQRLDRRVARQSRLYSTTRHSQALGAVRA